ncbi:MAG: hypothetical protein AAF570_15955, partial [Bacteroidota bacterium]
MDPDALLGLDDVFDVGNFSRFVALDFIADYEELPRIDLRRCAAWILWNTGRVAFAVAGIGFGRIRLAIASACTIIW